MYSVQGWKKFFRKHKKQSEGCSLRFFATAACLFSRYLGCSFQAISRNAIVNYAAKVYILNTVSVNAKETVGGLSRPEIYTVVNRYIGVYGGYLGDFSYRSHSEFYLEFCDLDIDPFQYDGTTRERFIKILSGSTPEVQAKILKGLLKKYPVGSSELRTQQRYDEIQAMIRKLEAVGPVASPTPKITSQVVERAINDAETLLRSSGATSGVDRIHTAMHGYLKLACDDAHIPYTSDATTTELFKALKLKHPKLQSGSSHGAEIDRILRAFSSVLDSLNTLRNRASVVHPNEVLLEPTEALLTINVARTLLHYLDSKLSPG